MCNDTPSVIWEKDELEKEQIRGVFAIGVLAILFGYQTIKSQFSGVGIGGLLIDLITVFLGTFWGLYITCAAFSMLNWDPGKKEGMILRLAKEIGMMSFRLGTIFSVLWVIILAPLLIFESMQQNPTYYIIVGFIAIALVIITIVSRYLKRKKVS